MKDAFIQQGWVPETCELTSEQALALAHLAFAGVDLCAGCNHDRDKCHGRPKEKTDEQRTG